MAIYHLTTRLFSRGNRPLATVKFDYLTRRESYRQKDKELVHHESGSMPSWAEENPRAFWVAADKYELVNGRFGREIGFALPRELSAASRFALAREFTQAVTQGKHPYTLALHAGQSNNPHAHLIFRGTHDGIEREAERFFRRANPKRLACGGARKDKMFNKKAWLHETCARWAELANAALERQGLDTRIDHRTLQEQGITDRLPQRHLGTKAAKMVRRGKVSRRTQEIMQDSLLLFVLLLVNRLSLYSLSLLLLVPLPFLLPHLPLPPLLRSRWLMYVVYPLHLLLLKVFAPSFPQT